MKLNTPIKSEKTHEGAVAKNIKPLQQLRRSVMACMLWEGEFYEDGQTIADRICNLIPKIDAMEVSKIAIEARSNQKLRHVPLLIAREMARYSDHRKLVAATLDAVIQRPDELCEFMAIYWKDGKCPVAKQVKLGLARAFTKFDEYQLSKYNRDGAIKLRDVLFICHAKPENKAQEKLWKRLIDGTMKTPDTWETSLSAGKEAKTDVEKNTHWTRLLEDDKLGGLALLRNLRNMQEAKVETALIKQKILAMKTGKILPFRFISAAKHAPQLEPQLEKAMFQCLAERPKLGGNTHLMVDVSGSMIQEISDKSDLFRMDAACALAMLLAEICEDFSCSTFSQALLSIPPRRGFALRDVIIGSQPHGLTYLGAALKAAYKDVEYDRLIVITDEQSHDAVPDPDCKKGYMINVASNKNGVGYHAWNHIDGWSEACVDFIIELENNY